MKISPIALRYPIATLLMLMKGITSGHPCTKLLANSDTKREGYGKLRWPLTYISVFVNARGNSTYNAIYENPETFPGWQSYYQSTTNQYREDVKESREEGFRPIQIDGHSGFAVPRFSTLWNDNKNEMPWAEHINQSGDEFTKAFKDYVSNGYRLKSLSGYGFNGQQQFASAWEKTPGAPQKAYIGLTAAEYQTTFDQARKDGYYPVRISPYNVGKEVWFAGIFEQMDSKAAKPECQWGLTSDEYVEVFNNWTKKGYKPTVVNGYLDGEEKYAAIFNKFTNVKV
ncbi:beta-lactamase [Nannizzia gypsea CBS 118893]|uniref:Beta-lactamase n=1 Tax=Arthroderma gypseum (strain ATCC MYA-4604 / CBS 118893) TaxID=535722 RepID=E5QYJ1_ARTGP|nr:beta-lactamase [Nannizzia gypsea CBS 118893]EFQ98067.1 beta-lactamase [Nannizzia gypsea CBS 118893]